MSASTEMNDDAPAPEGVVERLDRARARMKAAAKKAQEQIAPTLERATETAEKAQRQAKAAGQEAVAKVRRNPLATGLVLAGIGIGAFLLIRSSARNRLFDVATDLWDRHDGRDRLRDFASDGQDRLRDLVSQVRERTPAELSRLGDRVDLSALTDKVRELTALVDRVQGEVRRRLAA